MERDMVSSGESNERETISTMNDHDPPLRVNGVFHCGEANRIFGFYNSSHVAFVSAETAHAGET